MKIPLCKYGYVVYRSFIYRHVVSMITVCSRNIEHSYTKTEILFLSFKCTICWELTN
jgi:hypothetical protein